jgi:uncharacterized membrane-anchored protein
MEVDKRGHIHVNYDEFIWIKDKDGKDSLGYLAGMLMDDLREAEGKLEKIEANEDIDIRELDLCTNCNPFKDVSDGRKQSILEVES